jgi:tetrahydroxynaphthalene reductase
VPISLFRQIRLINDLGRGIGAAIALELAQRGARVAVNYLNSVSDAEQVVKRIKDLGNGSDAALFQANVDNVEEIGKLMDNVVAHFGRLDICCSNAGVHSSGHFSDVKADDFDRTFTTNTRAQFFVAQEAYKRMEVGGRIIFMSSITAQAKSIPEHAVYAGSKGAIESFARCMAVDAGEKKVTVNCVAPGGIKTDMFYSGRDKVVPDDEKGNVDVYISKLFPHNRIGETCDVSRVVAFLASQDGEWVNGKVIGIDGGANM